MVFRRINPRVLTASPAEERNKQLPARLYEAGAMSPSRRGPLFLWKTFS